jgi:hypothetical protein
MDQTVGLAVPVPVPKVVGLRVGWAMGALVGLAVVVEATGFLVVGAAVGLGEGVGL